MPAMEGQLKKRGAKMPVMHDRYCVATWEINHTTFEKFVLLRSFKSHKGYLETPAKFSSACTLKSVAEWNGKSGFSHYEHAFQMESSDGHVFYCAAPTAGEKTQWLAFMANWSAPSGRSNSSGDLRQLFRTSSNAELRQFSRTSSDSSTFSDEPWSMLATRTRARSSVVALSADTFIEPRLGYVYSGLSTMVPSFATIFTSLSRQQQTLADERMLLAEL
ncbi:hypothetical protein PybrP1_002152 [[Pythium] brassicae (nom. inval.)]|nr:hypothetical protein PybrP1_002152 [[Pythium] brassicae (nom. inval.)]